MPGLTGLQLAEAAIHASPRQGRYGGNATFRTDWTLSVTEELTFSLAALTMSVSATLEAGAEDATIDTATIGGELVVAKAPVWAVYAIGGPLEVHAGPITEGPLADISLTSLLDGLLTDFDLNLGDLPSVDLQHLTVDLRMASDDVSFHVATDVVVGELGAASVSLEIADDGGLSLGVTFGFPGDWRLSKLGGPLIVLDFLVISDTSLSITAHPTDGPNALVADLGATLALQGGHGLEELSQILHPALGDVTLQLSAHLPLTDLIHSTAEARLAFSDFWLVPQVVQLRDFKLDVRLEPIDLVVAADLEMIFPNGHSFRFGAGASLTAGDVSLYFYADSDAAHPIFTISVLSLARLDTVVTYAFEDNELEVTLGGDIEIGKPDDPHYPPLVLRAEAQVSWEVGEDPPYPSGLLTQKVSDDPILLGQLFQELVGPAPFPDAVYAELLTLFDGIEIDAFTFIIAVDPDGWNIPDLGPPFPEGVAMVGTFDVYGFHADLRLTVQTSGSAEHDTAGMSGSADISPLSIQVEGQSVLSLTGHGGEGDPVVSISTWGSPYVDLSARLLLLGMAGIDVLAVVDPSTSTYVVDFDLDVAGALDVCFSGSLTSTSFATSACFDAGLDTHIDLSPPTTTWGVLHLGTLHVALTAHLELSLRAELSDTPLTWSANGSFTWEGDPVTIPELSSTAFVTSFDDMVTQLVTTLASAGWDWVRACLVADVDALVSLAQQGIIAIARVDEEISHAAKVLKEAFGRTLSEGVGDLGKLGFAAWESTVMAARAWTDATHDEIANAVRDVYGDTEEVADDVVKGFGYLGVAYDVAYAVVTSAFNVATEAVLEAIEATYEIGVDAMMKFLDGLGYAEDRIEDLLEGAGYAAGKIADALEDFFDWLPDLPDPDWPWNWLAAPSASAAGTQTGRYALEQRLAAAAAADPKLLHTLLQGPPDVVRATVGRFFGTDIPEAIRVTVLAEDATTYIHVVPAPVEAPRHVQPPQLYPRVRFRRRVNWLAMHQAGFHDALLADGGARAADALREELGVELPAGLRIKTVQESTKSLVVVLRNPAHDAVWQGPYAVDLSAPEAHAVVERSPVLELSTFTLAVALRPDAASLKGGAFRPVVALDDAWAVGIQNGRPAVRIGQGVHHARTRTLDAGVDSLFALVVDACRVKLVFDGLVVVDQALPTVPVSTGPLRFGGGEPAFGGCIDHVVLWGRRVSTTAMWRHMRGAAPAEGVVGSWALRRGFGPVAHDDSGHRLHARLLRAPWVRRPAQARG